jgi:hypothetical protein
VRRGNRFDELWRESASSFDFVLLRDAGYLRWRYLDPRGGAFTLLHAEQAGEPVGYIAFALDGERCRIADILVQPGRADVAGALVDSALSRAREAGVAAVSCWLPMGHPYMPALTGHGFLDSRRETGLQYRPLQLASSELDALREPTSRLHITQGDMDIV